MTQPAANGPAPVSVGERLVHIDIIRGFALFGVVVSNIHVWFRAPKVRLYDLSYATWPGFGNEAATWLIRALIDSKFIFLFTLLFGVSLAIQMDRTEAKGAHFGSYATRRLLALTLIGFLHILLVWSGDQLHTYGIIGFMLLPFLHRKPKTIYWWIGSIWAFALVMMLIGAIRTMLGPQPVMESPAEIQEWDRHFEKLAAAAREGFGATSWWAVMQYRCEDYLHVIQRYAGGFIIILVNFLMGLSLWKSGILKDPAAHLPRLKRFCAWALPVGLLLNGIYASQFTIQHWINTHFRVGRFALPVLELAPVLGAMLLALAFAAGILVLTQSLRWKRWLAPLAPLGRMALTTYLTQSIVLSAIFYGWGLGYYDRMGPLAGAMLGIVIFALQIPLSAWWLRRFKFGPAEWLWRCMTYAKLQPFRIDKGSGALRPATEKPF